MKSARWLPRLEFCPAAWLRYVYPRPDTGADDCDAGTIGEAQKLDGIDDQEEKRYIHHYNFPSYSVGETARAADRVAAKSVTARWRNVRWSL
jgi:hypothetical protein